jgi:hypothetical protein
MRPRSAKSVKTGAGTPRPNSQTTVNTSGIYYIKQRLDNQHRSLATSESRRAQQAGRGRRPGWLGWGRRFNLSRRFTASAEAFSGSLGSRSSHAPRWSSPLPRAENPAAKLHEEWLTELVQEVQSKPPRAARRFREFLERAGGRQPGTRSEGRAYLEARKRTLENMRTSQERPEENASI